MSEEEKTEITETEKVETTETEFIASKTYGEDFVQKLLTEKRNATAALKEEREKLQVIEQDNLVQSERWKEAFESKSKQYDEVQQKFEAKSKLINESAKRAELSNELRKLGCNEQRIPRIMKFADFQSIQFDEETSTVTGTATVAKLLKEEIPEFFAGAKIGVNQSPSPVTDTSLTLESWKKLPYDERQKTKSAIYKMHGHERK